MFSARRFDEAGKDAVPYHAYENLSILTNGLAEFANKIIHVINRYLKII